MSLVKFKQKDEHKEKTHEILCIDYVYVALMQHKNIKFLARKTSLKSCEYKERAKIISVYALCSSDLRALLPKSSRFLFIFIFSKSTSWRNHFLLSLCAPFRARSEMTPRILNAFNFFQIFFCDLSFTWILPT